MKSFVSAGAIDADVPHSMMQEMLSGLDAVLVLCVESFIGTSNTWAGLRREVETLELGEIRSAFCVGELALVPMWYRL